MKWAITYQHDFLTYEVKIFTQDVFFSCVLEPQLRQRATPPPF